MLVLNIAQNTEHRAGRGNHTSGSENSMAYNWEHQLRNGGRTIAPDGCSDAATGNKAFDVGSGI